MLTVIIPTFNEKENVRKICNRIASSLKNQSYEILFVDDSSDNTPEILSRLARDNKNIRFIHRENQRGLATAVTLGFELSKGDVISVMDADLQHPPELLAIMAEKISVGSDLVIPSRFIPGGDDGGLKGIRKLVSRTGRLISWIFLKGARRTTDPMSGFFMLKKEVVKDIKLNPVGWKILLEILVKGHYNRVVEIPYVFQPRLGDQSKMSVREQLNYLHHIFRLVSGSPEDSRFWKFALVGISGIGVNMAVYSFFLSPCKLPVIQAGTFASLTAMLSNFILNSRITWPNSDRQQTFKRLLLFYIFCGLGVFINTMVLALFTYWLHFNNYAAQLLGIAAATLWNFNTNNRWNWGHVTETKAEEIRQKEIETEEQLL